MNKLLLIFIFLSSNAFAATDWTAAAGSKMAYKLDESSSTATDSTSNANTGTVTGTTRPSTGIYNSGYLFTIATTDSILSNHGASIADTASGSGLTVAFWAKITSFSATVNQRYWQKGNTDMFLLATGGGAPYNIYFGVDFSTTDGLWHWATALTDGNWHHYCLTYNGTSSSNSPILYIDGSPQSLTTDTAPVGSYSTESSSDLIVGNITSGGTRPMGGILDEFLWYSGIFTTSQVMQLMYNGLDGTTNTKAKFLGVL